MTPNTPAGGAVACPHSETTPKWDHHVCKRCGAVNADSGFGIASGKWFATLGDAKFYKQHGRIPDAVTIRSATVPADAVLALVADLRTEGQREKDDMRDRVRDRAYEKLDLANRLEALTRGEK